MPLTDPVRNYKHQEFVSARELAQILGISEKTITNNAYRIIGRAKPAGRVRYHLPTIRSRLLAGGDLYMSQTEAARFAISTTPRVQRKRSILQAAGSSVSRKK